MINEKDIVTVALRAQEKWALDTAKELDQKASDARESIKVYERDAEAARARADKFKAAITRLGA